MSENFRLDRKMGFRNTFYTKCINVIIDSIGPSIILRSLCLENWALCPCTVIPIRVLAMSILRHMHCPIVHI